MPLAVTFVVADVAVAFECARLDGFERIGEPVTFEVDPVANETVAASKVLGKACGLRIECEYGSRVIPCVVTHFVARATASSQPQRRYKATVRSAFALLELVSSTRIFQKLSVPKTKRGAASLRKLIEITNAGEITLTASSRLDSALNV